MKQICRILFLLLLTVNAHAQSGKDSSGKEGIATDTSGIRSGIPGVKDTLVHIKKAVRRVVKTVDTIAPKKDTAILMRSAIGQDTIPVVKKEEKAVARREPYKLVIHKNPWYNFQGQPVVQTAAKREEAGREGQFYLLCGVILIFALIKSIFSKYLQNLFAVFFRISMKQKQLREQLLQTPLPSLLLNLLFVMTGGIYASYVMRYYGLMNDLSQGLLVFYSAAVLAVVYVAKLLILKLTGWIFNMREATDTYIFVVFLVNKLLGIFLLPLILFIAFSDPQVVSVVITLSYITIFIFFGYRYLISYSAVRKEIKVSPFHFFLYLCAFEIIPLVLIYKVLLEFVYRSP